MEPPCGDCCAGFACELAPGHSGEHESSQPGAARVTWGYFKKGKSPHDERDAARVDLARLLSAAKQWRETRDQLESGPGERNRFRDLSTFVAAGRDLIAVIDALSETSKGEK